MHNSMQYDPIQGQEFKAMSPWKLEILPFLKALLCHLQWELATDHWFLNEGTISKFGPAGIFDICPSFLSCDFEVGRNVITSIVKSRPLVSHWSNFHFYILSVAISVA